MIYLNNIDEQYAETMLGVKEMIDAFITTPAGAHAKAKELGIKAYNLGCSCYNCNKEFDEVMNRKPDVIKAALSVGIDYKNTRPNDEKTNVYEREIWNAAIEAAAERVRCESDGMLHYIQIQELKK